MAPGSMWATLGPDIAAALTTAAILGLLAWGFSRLRNLSLERDLRRAIDPNGIGYGYEPRSNAVSYTLQIHNYSAASIRVRAVVFKATPFSVSLEPDVEFGVSQIPLENEVARPKFKRQHLSRPLEPSEMEGAMVLPPKTMGMWRVRAEQFGSMDRTITGAQIVFEYPTVFGHSALVRMEAPRNAVHAIRQVFDEVHAAVKARRPLREPSEIYGRAPPSE